jgi:protein TonB
MNSYLEQGDYARAQSFLKELYNPQKSAKPVPSAHYFAAAGQVVKGARNQLERYRALGLTVSDRSLPLEAAVDIEKMRETLELVVEHSKIIGKEKDKTANAVALLEEATSSRSNLAKDDYDAKRWKDEIGDAREQLTSPRSVITNAMNDSPIETPVSTNSVASTNPVVNSNTTNTTPTESSPVFKPVSTEAKPGNDSTATNNQANNAEKINETAKASETPNIKPSNSETAQTTAQPSRENKESENKESENKTENATETQTANTETTNENSPLKVGSLVSYATNQARPVYPIAAKNMRMTGVVKVEVLVNENGEVSEVQNTTGPSMLQRAATDAVKKWKFKPFVRGGQPVKASGFVNFNFSL